MFESCFWRRAVCSFRASVRGSPAVGSCAGCTGAGAAGFASNTAGESVVLIMAGGPGGVLGARKGSRPFPGRGGIKKGERGGGRGLGGGGQDEFPGGGKRGGGGARS